MSTFTVIGFWQDNLQRFCTSLAATSADAAESLCVAENSGLVVCGVIAGDHPTLDTEQYLTCLLQ